MAAQRSRTPPRRPAYPLLLSFDINKSIILADTIMNKSIDDTIREEAASRFWGHLVEAPRDGEAVLARGDDDAAAAAHPDWAWTRQEPSLDPPEDLRKRGDKAADEGGTGGTGQQAGDGAPLGDTGATEPVTYLSYCRKVAGDKKKAKKLVASGELIRDPETRQRMNDFVDMVAAQMAIPEHARTEELASATGLSGVSKLIFPSFFRFIAHLQRQGRQFSVFFRSFGIDLHRVRVEWNAFCEMRHPLFKHYLDDIGPMDGTTAGVPDRRLREEDVNTMYRDEAGAVLARHVITNGREEGDWDKWARSKQLHPDIRDGRAFIQDSGIDSIDGYAAIQSWLADQVQNSHSQMIRDDWAWWNIHKEDNVYGKLMLGVPGVQQLFFDDNVGADSLRIVDPRYADTFEPVPCERCLDVACLRVDPLQAILDERYFIAVFDRAKMDLGADALASADRPLPELGQNRSEVQPPRPEPAGGPMDWLGCGCGCLRKSDDQTDPRAPVLPRN